MDVCWPTSTFSEAPILLVTLSTHILISVPRNEPGPAPGAQTPSTTITFQDTRTGICMHLPHISCNDLVNIALPRTTGTIAVVCVGGAIHTYDLQTGEKLWEGKLPPQHESQLGAHWVHNEPFRFAARSLSRGTLTISIYELPRDPGLPLHVVASFPAKPHDGEFSFSPTSYHASFVTETKITILDVQRRKTQFQIEETSPLYAPPGRFSHDGSIFACGTVGNEIYVWKKTSHGYGSRGILRPLLPFMGFAISPVATSILSWGPEGLELFGLEDFTGGSNVEPTVRRAVAGPGQPRFHL